MPTRQEVARLGRNLRGLEKYPMSASYPQESGDLEFKKILQVLRPERGNKMETTVEIHEGKSLFRKILCGKEETIDTEEVDGRVEEILKPLVKLYFLKILLIDIGISLGDVVTDLAQGINLIFDHNWNIQWSTFHYGLTVISLTWLPVVPLSIHVLSFKDRKYYSLSENPFVNALLILLLLIFFPLLPTLMYVRILIMRRNFTTNRNKLKFLEFEDKTTELKALVGSIESPLQFILMLWLMFRGILTLPWDQPLSSSCVEDSLGRVACLPSIPMLSMLFSLLSIIKSVFDLNMFAVSSASMGSLTRSKVCQHLVLCFFPFYLCNILFRLPAYAFILCFIDIWSMIPAVILFILQLALCGLFFIRQESEDQDLPMDDLMVGSYGTINEASTDDEGRHDQVDGPPGLVWDGEQWISRSVMGNIESPRKVNIEDGVSQTTQLENIDPVSLIDEQNAPLFLNSLAGIFFPCVHIVFKITESSKFCSLKVISELLRWQMKVMMSQTLLFNISIIVVLFSIFILVTFIESFNYKYNIFNFFWFSVMTIYLTLMGVATSVWSVWIYPSQIFPIEGEVTEDAAVEPGRRRHRTGDSGVSMVGGSGAGPDNGRTKLCYSLLLSLLSLLPHHQITAGDGQTLRKG